MYADVWLDENGRKFTRGEMPVWCSNPLLLMSVERCKLVSFGHGADGEGGGV